MITFDNYNGGVKVSTGILKCDKRVENAPISLKGARFKLNDKNNFELAAA